MTEPIEPVVVAVEVGRGVEEAFRVFTAEIAAWWPVADHSVEPDRVETVVLEGRVGGRLYERWHDGGEVDWGRVLAWEPPARLVLSWSPTLERRPPTEVEVRFLAVEPDHTRVELEHRGWERLGDLAAQARSSYEGGWPGVLDAFAGTAMAVHHRRSPARSTARSGGSWPGAAGPATTTPAWSTPPTPPRPWPGPWPAPATSTRPPAGSRGPPPPGRP